MDRIWKGNNKVFTIIGWLAAVLGEIGGQVGLFPAGSRLHAICAACALLGTALRFPGAGAASVPEAKPPASPPTPPTTPAALVLVLAGSLLLAPALAFADDAAPGGPIPSLGGCIKVAGKDLCAQPTVMVASVIDLRSGNIERGVALGAGYALIFPKAFYSHDVGANIVGGILTGGNWQASISPRLGNAFLGLTLSHKLGVNYLGANFGIAY